LIASRSSQGAVPDSHELPPFSREIVGSRGPPAKGAPRQLWKLPHPTTLLNSNSTSTTRLLTSNSQAVYGSDYEPPRGSNVVHVKQAASVANAYVCWRKVISKLTLRGGELSQLSAETSGIQWWGCFFGIIRDCYFSLSLSLSSTPDDNLHTARLIVKQSSRTSCQITIIGSHKTNTS
jgi:hypothetical protein